MSTALTSPIVLTSPPERDPNQGIPARKLDPDALKVVGRLQRHGHEAYFVGGCVRDLLLDRVPKDYDVGTTARPRQVKQLFRNSRIIGRRFRLVHVVFGPNIIEVATFRGPDEEAAGEAEDLLIRTDNVYGSAEEDAFRRDFTVNGLFYDPSNQQVIDYVGGQDDLARRLISTIGDPNIRLREDPVRMIRAVKFAARLGFALSPATYDAIVRHRAEVKKSAAPRVAEEIVRLAKGGKALESFRLLADLGLLPFILPRVDSALSSGACPEFWAQLGALDAVEGDRAGVTRPLCLAVVFAPVWEGVRAEADQKDVGAAFTAAIRPAITDRLISRREADRVKQIMVAQRRLEQGPQGRAGKRGGRRRRRSPARALVSKEYFREALMFFRLRGIAQGTDPAAWEVWEEFVPESPETPEVSRWSRERQRGGAAGRPGSRTESGVEESGAEEPAARKRRRRRKRSGSASAESDTAPPQPQEAAESPRAVSIREIMPTEEGEPVINPYTGKPYARRPLEAPSKEAGVSPDPSAEAEASEARGVTAEPAKKKRRRPAPKTADVSQSETADELVEAADGSEVAKKKRRRRRRKKKASGASASTPETPSESAD